MSFALEHFTLPRTTLKPVVQIIYLIKGLVFTFLPLHLLWEIVGRGEGGGGGEWFHSRFFSALSCCFIGQETYATSICLSLPRYVNEPQRRNAWHY